MSARRPLAAAFLDDRSGATAVELALVLPLLITLMFGVFQFGWTQHTLSSIRYAMERSSRDLMLDPTLTEAELQASITETLDELARTQTTVRLSTDDTPSGRIATLTTTYVSRVGVPGLATFEIPHQVSIKTALRTAL